jgi:hypothetical protein
MSMGMPASGTSAMSQYDDLFTFARDAQLWGDLYERPTELYHHHMARRRDYAHAFKITVADVSDDMFALARERLRRFPARDFRLWQANCEKLPFDDADKLAGAR